MALGMVSRALTRRGLRWAGSLVGTVVVSRREETLLRVRARDGFYVVRYPDGWVTRETLTGPPPEQMRREALDIFCHGYTPNRGDVVLDVGAGAGEDVLAMSELVGPEGRVIAVEAHPATFERLSEFCRLNRLTNVQTVHAAVADADGLLHIDGGSHRGGYLSARLGSEGVAVPATTLDALVRRLGLPRVDLLKMNIEGAERLALKGMPDTLRRTRHLAISCHDFMADPEWGGSDPAWVCTVELVEAALRAEGVELLPRRLDDPRPFVRYYVYGHRPELLTFG